MLSHIRFKSCDWFVLPVELVGCWEHMWIITIDFNSLLLCLTEATTRPTEFVERTCCSNNRTCEMMSRRSLTKLRRINGTVAFQLGTGAIWRYERQHYGLSQALCHSQRGRVHPHRKRRHDNTGKSRPILVHAYITASLLLHDKSVEQRRLEMALFPVETRIS